MHAQPASSRDGRCPTCGNPDPFDRSDSHHGLFFAVVRMAFIQWPINHEFQPRDEPHLRAWLLIEAGHYKEREFIGPRNLLLDTIRGWREFINAEDCRVWPIKNGVRVRFPKSIKKSGPERVGKKEFEDISRKVFEIVEAATGVDIEKWKGEQNKWHAA